MEIKLSEPVGHMSIVVDAASRKAEVLDVDRLHLLSFVVNAVTGIAQFAIGFGGLDSNGTFHLDPARAGDAGHLTIVRENQQELFDSIFKDDKGCPKVHFPREFFYSLMPRIVESAYAKIGAKYPNLDVALNGKRIFLSEKGCVKKLDNDRESEAVTAEDIGKLDI